MTDATAEPLPGGTTEPPEERSRRIEAAVQRDLARRRRLIQLYLALLLVPLAVAAVLMAVGRTDREVVAAEVEQRVAVEVDQRIQPVEESYREIAPMIEEVRGFNALVPDAGALEDRFAAYERGQSELAAQVTAVTAEVQQIEPVIAEARAAKAQVEEMRREYSAQQLELSKRIDVLGTQLGPAAEGALRPPRDAAIRAVEPRAAEVATLERRIKELEATVTRLQRETRALRTDLDRARSSPPR